MGLFSSKSKDMAPGPAPVEKTADPAWRINPYKDAVPVVAVWVSLELMERGQYKSYWANHPMPVAPHQPIRGEMTLMYLACTLPVVLASWLYFRFGAALWPLYLLAGYVLALVLMGGVKYLIDAKHKKWMALDRGRWAATQFLSKCLGIPQQDITFKMVEMMGKTMYDRLLKHAEAYVAQRTAAETARAEEEERARQLVAEAAHEHAQAVRKARTERARRRRRGAGQAQSGTSAGRRREYEDYDSFTSSSVNPATGLPMLGGVVDVGGHPYGTNW